MENIHETDNPLKEIEAYLSDERALKSSAEVQEGIEEIKALLEEKKLYIEEKCKLEEELMQNEIQIKQTQKMIKRHSKLEILVEQQEKKKFDLLKQYEDMIQVKSQSLRDSHKYYKKENIAKELAMAMKEFEELSNKKKRAQNVVDELQRESDEMNPFHSIMGKEVNDEKLKENNPQNNETSTK